MFDFSEVKAYDPELAAAMEQELTRQQDHIELIASENFVSKAVMAAMGSHLTNKYAEGYPGKRYYGGCQYVDIVEDLARERAKELFGCEYVNVQPHSGAQANMAVFFAVLQPGDTYMGMNLDMGGHLSHGSPVNISGKYFHCVPYGVNDDGFIDYDEVLRIAKECQPKMIIADEPTGNIDPEMSYEIIELLSEINKRGTTVLVVTHEHELVKSFGKRVITIDDGRVVSDTDDDRFIAI